MAVDVVDQGKCKSDGDADIGKKRGKLKRYIPPSDRMTRLMAKQTSHSNQSYCCGSFGTWGGSISVTLSLSLTSKIWSDIMISNYWLFLNRKLYIVSYRVLHSKWDFFFGLHGGDENSHIWVMWKDGLRLSPMFISSQSITLSIHIQHDHHAVVFCIYASCLERIRQLL